MYKDGIWKSFELYIFQLYLLLRVAQFAEKDAEIRAAKLLPSDNDKTFDPRLSNNPCTKSLADHVDFFKLVKKYKVNEAVDEDHIRSLYQSFADSAEYKAYLALEAPETADHNKILLELYKHLSSKNELYADMSEDRYNNWSDDESLVSGAMAFLKAMPLNGKFTRGTRTFRCHSS